MNSSLIKNIFIIITITLVLFVLILEGLRVIPIINNIAGNISKFISPLTFEKRYLFSDRSYKLDNHDSNDPALKFYQSHSTRGWTTKKNLKIFVEGDSYTTNNIGERSLIDYKKDESKYEVLVLGDSMSFGEGSSDELVWTNIIRKENKNVNIINLAVPGYGIGQMYIVLKETIKIYKPDLVILAFVKDDFARTMLSFREARKPYFEIKQNELVLTNTPIKEPDEVYEELIQKKRNKPFYKKLKIYELFTVLFNSSTYRIGEENRFHVHNTCDVKCLKHNKKIFLESFKLSKKNNSDFIALYIPGEKRDRTEKNYVSYADKFLEDLKVEFGMNYLNLRPYFYDKYGFVTRGHYGAKGLNLIADTVNKQILLNRLK
jgi:hypothetical protein|tara:strand:+ start:1045 stop:2169 length:1125 start_codon:yes stop_codon:yes gene_type:complete